MIPSNSDRCMVAENPDGHPAVDAWIAMDTTHQKPKKVIALYATTIARRQNRTNRKSMVYKLEGACPDGSAIVAKRCTSWAVKIEHSIYEHILPELPVSSLQYYGHTEIGDSHWLFLEYSGGVEWNVDNNTHLDLATKWLAAMHGNSAHVETLSLLPNRGPRYYLSQLTAAQQRIQESLSNPALGRVDIEILDNFLACSSLLEAHWLDIEAFCETIPKTLVHSDFINKNLHVRTTESGPVLFPFDWEMSGKGVPAVDLFWMFQLAPDTTITRYWELLREFNTNIDLRDIEYLAILGTIFRALDSVEWASYDFSTHSPGRRVLLTNLYTDQLNQAYHKLGWS